ncbi:MAG: hypothetical protein LBS50_03480 [Prevotellaceae bacterium]|jgi:hypothetical protein|nr:hypothetical protein [Prevotellaceae bacterium]
MKKLLFIGLFGAFTLCISAQPRSIGLRLGLNQEFSFQQYLNNESNFLQIDIGTEALQAVELAVTYNWFSDAKNSNIKSFWGFGGGAGFSWRNNDWYSFSKAADRISLRQSFFIGIVGMAGLEYEFSNIPLTLAFDYRPLIGADVGDKYYPVTNTPINKFGVKLHTSGFLNFGLSIRYML